MNQGVNLVVALLAEARPLIDYFGLHRTPVPASDDLRIFSNERINLVVSGVGCRAATRAIQNLACSTNHNLRAWLNIGVAGHGAMEVGESFLAHSIIDRITAKSWYPMFVFEQRHRTSALMTVSEVETEFPEAIGYDMEAAGFYAQAIRYSTVELIHCFKVVSDNPGVPATHLNSRILSNYIEGKLPLIQELVTSLDILVTEVTSRIPSAQLLERFFTRWNFTVTQQHQLKILLQKSNVLGIGIKESCTRLNGATDASTVLRLITENLESYWTKRCH